MGSTRNLFQVPGSSFKFLWGFTFVININFDRINLRFPITAILSIFYFQSSIRVLVKLFQIGESFNNSLNIQCIIISQTLQVLNILTTAGMKNWAADKNPNQ